MTFWMNYAKKLKEMSNVQEVKEKRVNPASISQRGFEMFKHGKLNLKCPKGYNYALGYSTAGKSMKMDPIYQPIGFSNSKVNREFVIGN